MKVEWIIRSLTRICNIFEWMNFRMDMIDVTDEFKIEMTNIEIRYNGKWSNMYASS